MSFILYLFITTGRGSTAVFLRYAQIQELGADSVQPNCHFPVLIWTDCKKENCAIEAREHTPGSCNSQEVLSDAIPKFNLMNALISEPDKDKNRRPRHTYIYIKLSLLRQIYQKQQPHTSKFEENFLQTGCGQCE